MRLSIISALLLSTALTGCVGPVTKRSEGAVNCGAYLDELPELVLQESEARAAAGRPPPPMAQMFAPLEAMDEVNILVLSGGGQWGAYGAGFLSGWFDAEGTATPPPVPRADIHVITGISTGSMQATHALLGSADAPIAGRPAEEIRAEAHAALATFYKSVSDDRLFDKLGTLASFFSNAAVKPEGLEKLVDEVVRANIDTVAGLGDEKQMVIGLVNLDDGRFYTADLRAAAEAYVAARAAGGDGEESLACYKEIVLGSSAVPFLFPPRFIDHEMYVDGGARFGAFLLPVAEIVTRYAPKVNVFTIVNGNLSANSPACDIDGECPATKNKILAVAGRSSAVIVDQIYKDSLFRIETDLRGAGVEGETYYTWVDNEELREAGCKADPDLAFDQAFMNCLFDIGYKKGRQGADAWVTDFGEIPQRYVAPQ